MEKEKPSNVVTCLMPAGCESVILRETVVGFKEALEDLNRRKVMNKPKLAIIFGVTGQDGSYLAEHLLRQNYHVVGVKRRSSIDTTGRLSVALESSCFYLMEGDVTDYASVSGVFSNAFTKLMAPPDEVYNLAAQSHVHTSFEQPLATWDINAKGVLNILENIRRSGHQETIRFYQASTSEMFGDKYSLNSTTCQREQKETTPYNPRSPYAIAKLAAHNAVKLYHDAYGVFGCCGILFNHESERRGEEFVTRKITRYVGRLFVAQNEDPQCPVLKLSLGNLSARRDWGYAPDYVRAMHMMLQQREPNDYIVSTGESHSVAEFCELAFSYIGEDYKYFVTVDPKFIRPAEVPYLQGVSKRITDNLGWKPQVTFKEMVSLMVGHDVGLARKELSNG